MARAGLDKALVVEKAAQLANEVGLDHIQLKILAESLNIQPPSLYNHIKGIDDLRHELMLYGWRNMAERMIEAAKVAGGYAAWEASCRAFLEGFCLLVNNHSFGHSLPVEDSFDLSLKVLTAGMKGLEVK